MRYFNPHIYFLQFYDFFYLGELISRDYSVIYCGINIYTVSCTSREIHSGELVVALCAIRLHTRDARQHSGWQMMQYARRSGGRQPICRHLGAHVCIPQLLLHTGGEVIVVAKIKCDGLLISRRLRDRQISSLGELFSRHDVQ